MEDLKTWEHARIYHLIGHAMMQEKETSDEVKEETFQALDEVIPYNRDIEEYLTGWNDHPIVRSIENALYIPF